MTTTRVTSRLPRYSRADLACALTPRDLQILQTVESFRLLDSEHIRALASGSGQGILRRLQKLYHGGLLDRLRPLHVHGGGSQKMVYAITNRGLNALQKEGLIKEVSKTDRNASNRDLRKESIEHRLLISHIRTVFKLACQAGPDDTDQYDATFSGVCKAKHDQPNYNEANQNSTNPGVNFLFWREGRELFDRIEVSLPHGYAQIPVAPDGFFTLQDAQRRRAHLFVEADRGTMSLKRVMLKLQAYAAWSREKRQETKLGIKNFRVLTVTTSRARCLNLIDAAEEVEPVRDNARMFLFAAEEFLPLSKPAAVLSKVWLMPDSAEPHTLLGGPGIAGTSTKEEIYPTAAGTV